ncbi:MAG: FecR domain-containing protein, partial [Brachymonas sp.]
IGIRGTDFSVRICDDDCRAADGPQVASSRLPELAGRVGAAGGGVSAIDARGLWRGLNASSAVRPGDLLITGNSGVAIVVLTDGTRISLDPNSRFWIADYSFDAARPEAGRIALELVQGAAQVSSGQLAKIRPERFAFAAGEQVLRVHGTSWGAVVNTVNNAANDGADAGRNAANNAQDAAQNAANSAGNAAQNAVNTVTDTAKTIVTNTGQTAAAAGQQGSQLASTVTNQMSQVAGQVTQQGQTQVAQGSQAVRAALPPAPPPVSLPPVSLPAAPAPSGPPGPGYDITGGKVLNGASLDTITQGTFNTVITGQTQRREDYNFLLTETTEQIVPPTQVRTASGMLMTGGTILRRVDFNTFTGAETMTITFVGVTFAPPTQSGQPPQPGRPMVSACASCTGLVAQGWDVVPTKIEEARLRREAVAQQANRNSTGSGSGSGMMPLSCTGSSAQCDEVRRAREQEQANQHNTRSNRSGSSGSSSSTAPSPAPAPTTSAAPTPAPTAAAPAPAPAPASSNSTIVVTDGAVTSYSRSQVQGQFIAAGQLYNVNTAPAGSATEQSTTQRNLRQGSLPFVAPALDERTLSVDSTRLFGADVLRMQGTVPPLAGFVPAGVYVHVQDGAVSLAQDGQEVVIGRGETASAPAGGGAPSRVLRGVRVVAPALVSATRIATQGQCSADGAAGSSPTPPTPSMWGGRRVTASQSDLPDLRWTGDLTSKLNEKETSQATGGGSDKGFGNRWGVGFENGGRNSILDEVRGKGLQGAGRLQGPQNIVGGRFRDTFAGDKLNNASGQDVTFGGNPGRVGNLDGGARVSSGTSANAGSGGTGFAFGASTLASMLIEEGGTPTGDSAKDAAELSYAQSVGSDGYAATKNMNTTERQSYWGAERDQQMTGGGRMTPADAEAERNRQQQGGKENPDACASCGGNGLPLFLSNGQFGNEIRGVERAVNARINRAGGAADGRGERDASSGSTGSVMMSRNTQAGGTVRAAQTGTLNVDEALKLNRLVNPGAQ